MISKFAFTATGLLVALCMVSPTFAAPVVIDTFSSTIDVSGTSPLTGTVDESGGATDIISDVERDYSLTGAAEVLLTIQDDVSAGQNLPDGTDPNVDGDLDGATTFGGGGQSITALRLVWDGDDNDATDDDGLNTLPFSLDESLHFFILDLTSVNNGPTSLDITAQDITGDQSISSGHSLSAGIHTFALTGFTNPVGFTWSDLSWIALSFSGADDIQINYFGAESVPEPSSFALLSLGALGLCARRLRRRKGNADTAA